jgi:hypothetical protein
LLGKNIFSNLKHIFYFSHRTSKPPFRVTRVTISKRGEVKYEMKIPTKGYPYVCSLCKKESYLLMKPLRA